MSKIIVIAGKTSTGKSTAYCQIDRPQDNITIAGLDPKQTFIVNTVDKELPVRPGDYTEFRLEKNKEGKAVYVGNMITSWNYKEIGEKLFIINNNPTIKNVIIEDGQYLLAMDFFGRRQEKGYDKYSNIGYSFIWLIFEVLKKLRDDILVYIIVHTDEYREEKVFIEKIKTIGKMLDDKFTVEGLFSSILVAERVMKGTKLQFKFRVRPSTVDDIAKSVLGVFEDEKGRLLDTIPNDFGIIRDAYIKFYNIK